MSALIDLAVRVVILLALAWLVATLLRRRSGLRACVGVDRVSGGGPASSNCVGVDAGAGRPDSAGHGSNAGCRCEREPF